MSDIHNKGLIKKVKTAKGRKISSTQWLSRHINDRFVAMAKKQGYNSRAAFKLTEMAEKFKLFKDIDSILDIGCAPGGWLQVLSQKTRATQIVGVDLTAMPDMKGIEIIHGDFTDIETQNAILRDARKFDLILSDMAAKSCGIPDVDHLRIVALADMVLDFCGQAMKEDGNLVMKMLHGAEETSVIQRTKKMFKNVRLYKPEASYKDSKEVYLVALGFRL